MKRILIWDLPTRLFHWLLVACFATAWLTVGSDRWLSLHVFAGDVMLGLLVFRVVWGVIGGHYARFASFACGPKAGLAYLRALLSRSAPHYIGHNPAGTQAVFALLLLGLAVCLSGLLTQGGEEAHGPLVGLISIAAGGAIKEAHEVIAVAMLVLVIGHVAGVGIDSWLFKEDLPAAMVTGTKNAPEGTIESGAFRPVAGLMVLVLMGFGLWWFRYDWHEPVDSLLGRAPAQQAAPNVAFVGPKLAGDPVWREECGACHLAFHPNLLPARSWVRLMHEQGTHFGSDLGLDRDKADQLLAFLVHNAAENSTTEAAFKISHSIAPGVTPLRITETPYWLRKHRDIAEADWRLAKVKSRANCAACHLDAEAGTFEDAAMEIPR